MAEELTHSPWLALYVPLQILLVVLVLIRKREPSSALAWSLAIVFIPVIGGLAFLLFGLNKISRRLRRKIEHRASYAERAQAANIASELEGCYEDGVWAEVGQMLERTGGFPRREGHQLELYAEGSNAFTAILEAIEAAQHHVHIEYFIFRNDRLGGQILELLERKLNDGVEVRFLVDGIGTFASWNLCKRIRQAGGQAKAFLPLLRSRTLTFNLRTHRKIVICDGQVAFFGGLNVGEEYLGLARRLARLALPFKLRRSQRDWFDLHMRMQGPGVADLQRLFAENWDYATDDFFEGEAYFPTDTVNPPGACSTVPSKDHSAVQILGGGPDVRPNPIRQAYFRGICQARKSILVASPYLVPDQALREALKSASLAGVNVRVLTQGSPPDRRTVYECGQSFCEELLESGVKIGGLYDAMMHAKALVIDDEWAILGTANLDNRSMHLNFEQCAVLDTPKDVQDLSLALESAWLQSRPYDLKSMRTRFWGWRLLSSLMRMLAPIF